MPETEGVTNLLKSTPDDLINLFLQIGAETGRNRWVVGDSVNLLCQMVRDNKITASVMDCYIAAAIWLNREVSPRTVAYYSMVAGFFPESIRLEFEGLPFSHFALAHSLGSHWYEVLKLSSEYASEKGYAPSAAWVKFQIAAFGDETKEETEEDDEEQYDITEAERNIKDLATRLRKILQRFPIPDSIKKKVLYALDELLENLKFEPELDKMERERSWED